MPPCRTTKPLALPVVGSEYGLALIFAYLHNLVYLPRIVSLRRHRPDFLAQTDIADM